MYVIVCYDIEVERVAKALKICRKYLNWVQNSVFEGQITRGNLERLKHELSKIVKDSDSIRFYIFQSEDVFELEILGQDKCMNDLII
ncbi:CRISPR-associated endonuclease Cas2 [Pseudothermotoga thermarum]|uniref:CRISPR-associated endoribonuclease Cas2 n=1 Tax=Pseudothermotoga thermarum DSM 5069 TaxID=688269 RepID=F7YVS0_9THEM|nr:CRISPR-associated endonuclease Cas2 [Pseudothermotoga thermarum]AEH51739.1 CRISPR-associated protein, Cas2 family [Pseudothermotoga thermarum DSM 5069]